MYWFEDAEIGDLKIAFLSVTKTIISHNSQLVLNQLKATNI